MSDGALDNLAEQLLNEAEAAVKANAGSAASNDGNGESFSGDSGSGSGSGFNGDGKKDRNLQMILDIPLRVTVELGRTKMPVSELLNLTQGSVIELNKLAGEPMEVLVNDKLIARGEAVVVNEKFGVRLTDVISPAERVEQLK